MNWKMTMVAGAVLLTGCDMRPDSDVINDMRIHIRERCLRSDLRSELLGGAIVNPEVFCGCYQRRLLEGKSGAEVRQMEENPASYLEPPEDVVLQCVEDARRGTAYGVTPGPVTWRP